jgi:hypothetical protein
MRALLAVTAAGGATITGPDGTGAPVLSEARLAFTVTTPGGGPLVVDFTRAAGAGQVTTGHMLTTGLVVATMARARRHFGALLSVTGSYSDAERATGAQVQAGAVADRLIEVLFDDGDRSLVGTFGPASAQHQMEEVVARTVHDVNAGLPTAGLLTRLEALIAALTAERVGRLAADAMLAPGSTPLGAPA